MLSICLITKNEEKVIGKCLERLASSGHELVVIDTGSTDKTKEIVSKYTKNIFDFKWCDDFSAARNFATSKTKNKHILMVDSDEFLVEADFVELDTLIKKETNKVGRIHRKNFFTRGETEYIGNELVNRVYNKEIFEYEGKIHEQIVRKDRKSYETYVAPLFFDHVGYEGSKEDRLRKANRNIKILKDMLKEKEDPYVLYQLGKGYYYAEDYEEALKYFARALEFNIDINLEYVFDLVEMYGYSLLNTNRIQDALLLENIYEDFSSSADFLFLMGLIFMQAERFIDAEREFIRATKTKLAKVEGVNSYMAWYNAGVIRECLGDEKRALEYYRKCDGYQQALAGIERLKSKV